MNSENYLIGGAAKVERPIAHFPHKLSLLDLILIFLIGLGLLSWTMITMRLRYYPMALNDQISYILTARHFVETGILESPLIYPSTLSQDATKNYLYMPGYYYVLAASMALFGNNTFAWFLPSMLSYLVSIGCVFLIGRKIYSRRVGFVAAIVSAAFAPLRWYAVTAMAEITFVCSILVAFTIFVYIPPRIRPIVGAFLLVIPFLVRETGALLCIPMAGVILSGESKSRIKECILFLFASIVLLTLVYGSDLSRGRVSLMSLNLFYDEVPKIYADALASQPIANATFREVVSAVIAHIAQNVRLLTNEVFADALEAVPFLLMTASLPLITFYGFKNRDWFALSVTAFLLTALLMLVTLYWLDAWRGVRFMLFTLPLSLLVLAQILVRDVFPQIRRVSPALTLTLVLVCSILYMVLSDQSVKEFFSRLDSAESAGPPCTKLLDEIPHDNNQTIVGSPCFLPYIQNHYPAKWSFVPYNVETLDLLLSRYPVDLIIVRPTQLGTNFDDADLTRRGFSTVSSSNHLQMIVYRKQFR